MSEDSKLLKYALDILLTAYTPEATLNDINVILSLVLASEVEEKMNDEMKCVNPECDRKQNISNMTICSECYQKYYFEQEDDEEFMRDEDEDPCLCVEDHIDVNCPSCF